MDKQYKVFYNGTAATKEQLDEIEEIIVEQEVDRVWEAKIKIPVCISDRGIWENEDVSYRKDFERVRVEARIGEGHFIPLIDGRIVGQDMARSAVPGRSMVTIVVHDDSAKLHRAWEAKGFTEASDKNLVTKIFSSELSGKPDVDDVPTRPDNKKIILQTGTKMQALRSIAKRYNNFYVYVLPGEKPGMSIGCFKRLPTAVDKSIPTLEMFGENKNLAEFNVRQQSESAARVEGTALSLSDKSITSSTKSYRDPQLLEGIAATDAPEKDVKKRRLPPGHSDLIALDQATAGAANSSGYTLIADGSVLPLCYPGILLPYRMVKVCLSTSRYSTNYVIFKVTHTLGRSEYTQSFSLRGKNVAKTAETSSSAPAAAAAPSSNFNVQAGIH